MRHPGYLLRPCNGRLITERAGAILSRTLSTTRITFKDEQPPSETTTTLSPAGPSEVSETGEEPKTLSKLIRKPGDIMHYKMPNESPDIPKKHVFQMFRTSRFENPIYTLEQAAEYVFPDFRFRYHKYPRLTDQMGVWWNHFQSWDNQYTTLASFPDITDFVIVGGGLVGSGAAYYIKRTVGTASHVICIDKDPYGVSNQTAICSGLISCQSKSQDIWRMAQLSKELIRNLKRDLMTTDDDIAQIKYRPCTHLILWDENDADDAFAAASGQIDDGLHVETKLPEELEAAYPWLNVVENGVSIGTHGNQDEALIDPVGLRNLYRTLAQAQGVNFVQGEMLDFNTAYMLGDEEISRFSAAAAVIKLSGSNELRSISYCKLLLACGHSIPFLEAQAEMEEEVRDSLQDMHFLQPKLRVCMVFTSLAAPLINFPAITDTDGSLLIRDDFSGTFKYYLNMADCEELFDEDHERYMDLEGGEPYVTLLHKDVTFKKYFENIVKPKLVNRIPVMEDAAFIMAQTGFESHNIYDGMPVIGLHPFHIRLQMAGGFGRRLSTIGPATAAAMSELMLFERPETFDVTNFYWDRVMKGRKLSDFPKLIH